MLLERIERDWSWGLPITANVPISRLICVRVGKILTGNLTCGVFLWCFVHVHQLHRVVSLLGACLFGNKRHLSDNSLNKGVIGERQNHLWGVVCKCVRPDSHTPYRKDCLQICRDMLSVFSDLCTLGLCVQTQRKQALLRCETRLLLSLRAKNSIKNPHKTTGKSTHSPSAWTRWGPAAGLAVGVSCLAIPLAGGVRPLWVSFGLRHAECCSQPFQKHLGYLLPSKQSFPCGSLISWSLLVFLVQVIRFPCQALWCSWNGSSKMLLPSCYPHPLHSH